MALQRVVQLTLILCLLFGPATARCDSPPVAVSSRLTVAFAPADITFRVVIPRHPDNREACLNLAVDGVTISSCWTLSGETDRVEFYRTHRHLSAGVYGIVANVRRDHGWIMSKAIKLVVYDGAE